MFNRLLSLITLIFIFVSISMAQAVHMPGKGSPERKAILTAIRVPVEKQLKQDIIFAVNDFRVAGNWAFLGGEPQAAGGGQPDYSGTVYQEAKEADMFDNNFFALLKRTNGKWRVVTFAIGCTDVCYADWWSRYKAPKAVFPYTE